MYGVTPGFYLLAGPNWKGEVPKGITNVFRASTNTGYVIPRVFQDDSPEDNKTVQRITQQIMVYPLAEFDGTMKSRDWTKLRKMPSAASQMGCAREVLRYAATRASRRAADAR